MNQQTCTGCGRRRNEWKGNNGRGVEHDGQTYCCAGCANNSGCTC